jgi:hypothetical protein
MTSDEELSTAARSLHREWASPDLWPAIAADMAAIDRAHRNAAVKRRFWQAAAAAAVVVLAVSASVWVVRDGSRGDRTAPRSAIRGAIGAASTGARLLSDEALLEVERAEAQYISTIEALARKTSAGASASASPVLAHLRERLLVIDAAIADCRVEIERNRFNAHLRRQLLSIYQEKRRTLEQILEQEHHAS